MSNLVFVDEAGAGNAHPNLNTLFFTSGVAVDFADHALLNQGLANLRKMYLNRGQKELHAGKLPGSLLQRSNMSIFIDEFASLLDTVKLTAWIAGSIHGAPAIPGLGTTINLPQDSPKFIARHLLLERISMHLNSVGDQAEESVIITDFSSTQDLEDFGHVVSRFKNSFSNESLHPKVAPGVLGGLSHQWAGLQVADLFANFGLHWEACKRKLKGARRDKALLFEENLSRFLLRNSSGDPGGYGWKMWPSQPW
ncbi:MAG: DUF3800 domain-containing protein [Nitrososphaerota archaeon]|nr:DUF3800 domain-containing protein [Nitrososphaerota archaeon]